MSGSKAQGGTRQTGGGVTPRYQPGAPCPGCREAGIPAWQELLSVGRGRHRPRPGASESTADEERAGGLSFPSHRWGNSQSRRGRAEAGTGIFAAEAERGMTGGELDEMVELQSRALEAVRVGQGGLSLCSPRGEAGAGKPPTLCSWRRPGVRSVLPWEGVQIPLCSGCLRDWGAHARLLSVR